MVTDAMFKAARAAFWPDDPLVTMDFDQSLHAALEAADDVRPLESGYDPIIVFDFLDTHGTKREDGRYITLNGRLLEDTHRDTFDRWRKAIHERSNFVVPLGRWDEILLIYGVMLHEYAEWAQALYGTDGYIAADQG